jgi:UDP-N-acetylglucosamine 2-epimerase (non-hydrolysing)
MKVAPIIWAIQRHNEEFGDRRSEIGDREESSNEYPDASPISDLPSPAAPAAAPISHLLSPISERDARPIEYRLVHTGQHYDAAMSDVFFKELRIPPPDFNLDVGSGSHAAQTARIMERFEPVLLNAFAADGTVEPSHRPTVPPSHQPTVPPDWLVVVGDVNSTMACALVAAKLGVKIAHVEAGLRSFDRSMPEEINRIVTDSIADLLLTPSEDANENLRREGVPDHKIRLVGNIMIDALIANLDKERSRGELDSLGLTSRGFVYVTLHRPANVDHRESLAAIMTQLEALATQMPVVFPIHPRTRHMLDRFDLAPCSNGALKMVEPLGYHQSLALAEHAKLVLTDSGGLQEETTYFKTPCLTLRPNTERPVTITHGSNRLTCLDRLAVDLREVLTGELRRGYIPEFWDGHSAERILDELSAEGERCPRREAGM